MYTREGASRSRAHNGIKFRVVKPTKSYETDIHTDTSYITHIYTHPSIDDVPEFPRRDAGAESPRGGSHDAVRRASS
jgi:hypothetical protein